MRLLNVWTWEFQLFPSEDDRPPYAILSHTWSDHEVTLNEWKEVEKHGIQGPGHAKFDKIRNFGLLVRGDKDCWQGGLAWIWVDTCCIDKSSSAELSEAINSMFKWYSDARLCFAYLSDVDPPEGIPPLRPMKHHELNDKWLMNSDLLNGQAQGQISRVTSDFTNSRWFTRGWTLQELLAPEDVIFLYNDWTVLGHKFWPDIVGHVAERTRISQQALRSGRFVAEDHMFSIAQRMSWASERVTTRGEDMAYCLMGIFHVNMPLLYGEGAKRAFQRLQENIMASSHDQSLFAWGHFVKEFTSTETRGLDRTPYELSESLSVPWQTEPKFLLYGLLAESPQDFSSSADIQTSNDSYAHQLYREMPPTIVNRGVLLNLVIPGTARRLRFPGGDCPRIAWYEEFDVVTLMCRIGDQCIAIALHSQPDGYRGRTKEMMVIPKPAFGPSEYLMWTEKRHLIGLSRSRWSLNEWFRHRDVLLRTWDVNLPFVGAWCYDEADETSRWYRKEPTGLWGQWNDADVNAKVVFFHQLPRRNKVVGIVLRRAAVEGRQFTGLCIGVTDPISVTESQLEGDGTFLKEEIKLPESTVMHNLPQLPDTLTLQRRKGMKLKVRAEKVVFPEEDDRTNILVQIGIDGARGSIWRDEDGDLWAGDVIIERRQDVAHLDPQRQSMHVVDLSLSYESRRAAVRRKTARVSEKTWGKLKRVKNLGKGLNSGSDTSSIIDD